LRSIARASSFFVIRDRPSMPSGGIAIPIGHGVFHES
jgi:hypothetical protein